MTETNEREAGSATEAPSVSSNNSEWDQEKARVRVKQFMNILEQLPRLCSPTICGTLSQPTTRAERASRGGEAFEWSLEQKAILSPANITTDPESTEDWHHNASELNPAWRQQESEMFFSQRTIAPSPLITPSARSVARPYTSSFRDLMFDEDEENGDNDDDGDNHHQYNHNQHQHHQQQHTIDEAEEADQNEEQPTDQDMDYLFFSPEPLKSSQSQQRMEIFSPNTFARVMEDENTLQSTPRTTGSLQRDRTRTRSDVLD